MMNRRTAMTVGLVAACICGGLLVARAKSAEDAPPAPLPPYKAVAPVEALMHAQDLHFGRIFELIADPKAEHRFKRISDEAFVLAELCNVNAYRATESDYRGWALEARGASLAVAQAASKKDEESIKTTARAVQSTCRSCHDKYK